MENKQEILDALDEFAKQGPEGLINNVLEQYLCKIAATGMTHFPWAKIKPLINHKLNLVVEEFQKKYPVEKQAVCPNNGEFVSFEDMKDRLQTCLAQLNGIPFTIQRLCELLTDESINKQYKKADKFMRGLEKNLIVVTTVDPFGKQQQQQQVLNKQKNLKTSPSLDNNHDNNQDINESNDDCDASGQGGDFIKNNDAGDDYFPPKKLFKADDDEANDDDEEEEGEGGSDDYDLQNAPLLTQLLNGNSVTTTLTPQQQQQNADNQQHQDDIMKDFSDGINNDSNDINMEITTAQHDSNNSNNESMANNDDDDIVDSMSPMKDLEINDNNTTTTTTTTSDGTAFDCNYNDDIGDDVNVTNEGAEMCGDVNKNSESKNDDDRDDPRLPIKSLSALVASSEDVEMIGADINFEIISLIKIFSGLTASLLLDFE
ncbi:hypothetical protein HELRODRAFT_194423 [Helobdella robusta]|uniref:Serine/threonine-protein phosphatase 4 regulatory subunit 2 n=1 Tax=Helobdella robusta TaxID=6412 RepID=T1FW15_HELRO|nr:hypothetical protein HELRODRAFT_194423 [Helobdella robusta]ESN92043.1 hypothetical protein HELRODRAFT_194423 [Helobdella robusta]